MSHSSRSHVLQPTRHLHPWDFPGECTGVDCHFLLGSCSPPPKGVIALLPPLTNIYWAPLCAKHLFSNEDKLLMIQALKKTRSCFLSKPFTAIHFHQLRNSFHLRVMYIMNTDLFTFMVLITTLSNQRKC